MREIVPQAEDFRWLCVKIGRNLGQRPCFAEKLTKGPHLQRVEQRIYVHTSHARPPRQVKHHPKDNELLFKNLPVIRRQPKERGYCLGTLPSRFGTLVANCNMSNVWITHGTSGAVIASFLQAP
jgi:hypothetical protein